MKRLISLILIIVLSIALVPTQSLALAPPIDYEFRYVVHSTFSDGFMVNADLDDATIYGKGSEPLVLTSFEEYNAIFEYNTYPDMEDDYFDDHSVIVILAYCPTMGGNVCMVERVYGYGCDPIIQYTYIESMLTNDAIEYNVIEIHVNDSYLGDVSLDLEVLKGERMARSYKIFELGNLFIDIDPRNYYGKNSNPTPIYDKESFIEAISQYNDDELNAYASTLTDEFFADKMIVPILAVAPTQPTIYTVGAVAKDVLGDIHIDLSYDAKNALDLAMQCNLIIIEAERIDNLTPQSFHLHINGTHPNDVEFIGDVNGDQCVDQYDYIIAKRAYFGTYKMNSAEKSRADVDQNEIIDQYDYILIKRIYFGTYTPST